MTLYQLIDKHADGIGVLVILFALMWFLERVRRYR